MDAVKQRWRGLLRRSKLKGQKCCQLEHFREWYEKQRKTCCYCGIEEEFLRAYCTRIKATACLQVDRINNLEGYMPDNMALACYPCNSIIKKTRSPEFIHVVVRAILANNMLDEYHLWNVPEEKREAACFWHQFTRGKTVLREDGEEVYRYETPNTCHYLPGKQIRDHEPEGLPLQSGPQRTGRRKDGKKTEKRKRA